jgi:hypothetical protein
MDMSNLNNVVALKRIKGGFRRIIETELGEEQFCGSCREFWPTDGEFFTVSKQCLAYECKACVMERKLLRVVPLNVQRA